MKYDFPLKHIDGNLIFNDANEVWAVYELRGFTYEYKGDEVKYDVRKKLMRFLANIGAPAKIFVYPIARMVHPQFEHLREVTRDDAMHNISEQYFDYVEKYVTSKTKKQGNVNDYQFFLCVKLRDVIWEKGIKQAITDVPRTINKLLNVGTEYIVKEEIELYKSASLNVLQNLNSNVGMTEATPEQVQWMLARMMTRGLGGDVFIRKNVGGKPWKPKSITDSSGKAEAIYPNSNELRVLFEGTIEHNRKYIEVDSEDGHSVQAFLQFSHIPDGVAFPGGEYLKVLYDLPIASEICITAKPIVFDKAMEKVKRQSSKIEGQLAHTMDSGEKIPEALRESSYQIEGIEHELKTNRDPLIETTITICISGATRKEVDGHITSIRNFYKDAEYRVERSAPDQLLCFYQLIPGTQIFNSDYKYQLTPKMLATSMFLATRELGDRDGSYLGTIGTVEKPIYLNPFLATTSRYNRSPACFFMGTLGGGKSFNSNLLTYSVIMQGAMALIIDPKSERGKWTEELPEIADFTSTTTLGVTEDDRGKLDPFNIYRDELGDPAKLDEAADLARNIIMELYNIQPGSSKGIVLMEAINKIKNGVYDSKGQLIPPSMDLVHLMLLNVRQDDRFFEDATILARSIKATKEIGMSKLLFGKGVEKGLSFKTRVNILQIEGLNMPDPSLEKKEYNESQKLSTVLMIPIASFAKKFASQNRSQKKVILLDESWALRQTTEGKALFNYLARTGRSLNCCTIFIGHSVKDVDDEGLKAAITYKFCFKVNTSEEAKASLEFMELTPSEENIERLMKMKNGHALFKDLMGNVDELRFDAVAPHIAYAFNTSTDKYEKKMPLNFYNLGDKPAIPSAMLAGKPAK